MSTTQPIRSLDALQNFKNYYLIQKPNLRNYTLIVLGLNTALRINDLLHLTWDEIFISGKIKDHLTIKERKTGKENRILLNKEAKSTLTKYATSIQPHQCSYVFASTRNTAAPLSRYQAYRIVRQAAEGTNLFDHISCHSLRKTFGYHAWKQGTPPVLLMDIYNHSSYRITKRYLGIEQDDKDNVFLNIEL